MGQQRGTASREQRVSGDGAETCSRTTYTAPRALAACRNAPAAPPPYGCRLQRAAARRSTEPWTLRAPQAPPTVTTGVADVCLSPLAAVPAAAAAEAHTHQRGAQRGASRRPTGVGDGAPMARCGMGERRIVRATIQKKNSPSGPLQGPRTLRHRSPHGPQVTVARLHCRRAVAPPPKKRIRTLAVYMEDSVCVPHSTRPLSPSSRRDSPRTWRK